MVPEKISVTGSVLKSAELTRGVPVETDQFSAPSGWLPAYQEKLGKLTLSFLGLLFEDRIVADVLRGIVDLYPHKVSDGDDAVVSHQLSWDYWEKYSDKWSPEVPVYAPLDYLGMEAVEGVKIYSLPVDYREAILHFCAGERLGSIYPRLIHAGIMTYLLTYDDPEGPLFQSFITPNFIQLKKDAIDGYYQAYEMRLETGEERINVGTVDARKREVLSRVEDKEIKAGLSAGWDSVQNQRKEKAGYFRRRKISESSIAHVSWLFARHILGDPVADIALQAGVAESTVDSAIKNLRSIMDLQTKHSVHCLIHKVRPGRLHNL